MESADGRTGVGRPGDGDDPLDLLMASFSAAPAEGPPPPAPYPALPEPELPAGAGPPPSFSDVRLEAVPSPGLPPEAAFPVPGFDEPPLPEPDPVPEPHWSDAAPEPFDGLDAPLPEPTPFADLPSFPAAEAAETGLTTASEMTTESGTTSAQEDDAPVPVALLSQEFSQLVFGPEDDRPVENPAPPRPAETPGRKGAAGHNGHGRVEAAGVGNADNDPELEGRSGAGFDDGPTPDGPDGPLPTPDESAFAGWAPDLPDFDGVAAPVAPSALLGLDPPTPDGEGETPPGERHLAFALGGAIYAVPLAGVVEIGHPPRVTTVPHVPGWVLGVGSVRGDIVSVVDLRAFLGLPHREGRPGRFVLVRTGTGGVTAGLVVDGVREIFRVAPGELEAPDAAGAGEVEEAVRPYLRGLIGPKGRRLRLLDLEALLGPAGLRQFDPA